MEMSQNRPSLWYMICLVSIVLFFAASCAPKGKQATAPAKATKVEAVKKKEEMKKEVKMEAAMNACAPAADAAMNACAPAAEAAPAE